MALFGEGGGLVQEEGCEWGWGNCCLERGSDFQYEEPLPQNRSKTQVFPVFPVLFEFFLSIFSVFLCVFDNRAFLLSIF